MMTRGMELKNEDLMMVCGGNFGDAGKDNKPNSPRYQVGSIVEVYVCNIHIWTRRCKIISSRFSNVDKCWFYTCKRLDGEAWFAETQQTDPTCYDFKASSIERKN